MLYSKPPCICASATRSTYGLAFIPSLRCVCTSASRSTGRCHYLCKICKDNDGGIVPPSIFLNMQLYRLLPHKALRPCRGRRPRRPATPRISPSLKENTACHFHRRGDHRSPALRAPSKNEKLSKKPLICRSRRRRCLTAPRRNPPSAGEMRFAREIYLRYVKSDFVGSKDRFCTFCYFLYLPLRIPHTIFRGFSRSVGVGAPDDPPCLGYRFASFCVLRSTSNPSLRCVCTSASRSTGRCHYLCKICKDNDGGIVPHTYFPT